MSTLFNLSCLPLKSFHLQIQDFGIGGRGGESKHDLRNAI